MTNKKVKMGRPPKPPELRQNSLIGISVNTMQKNISKSFSDSLNINETALIFRIIHIVSGLEPLLEMMVHYKPEEFLNDKNKEWLENTKLLITFCKLMLRGDEQRKTEQENIQLDLKSLQQVNELLNKHFTHKLDKLKV